MNVLINPTFWHGQQAWTIENERLRTVVVPDLGAKLVSLFDKHTQREWLVGSGDRPLQKVPYGATFTDQDMSGWDEMFPTIVSCDYPVPGAYFGEPLPDHGEIWPVPWTLEPADPETLGMSVMGRALPYRLTRTLSYSAADTLRMSYQLENLGQEALPYIWAAHPQFQGGSEAAILLPPHIKEVCNVLPPEWGWGELEARLDWPAAPGAVGQQRQLDRTGPPSLRRARKFFVLPETQVSWAGLRRLPAGDWLRLDWDAHLVPYLGIWVDEGALSQETAVALEPMTGFYDSLAIAWEKQLVKIIEPAEIQSWALEVRVGSDKQPFPIEEQQDADARGGAS